MKVKVITLGISISDITPEKSLGKLFRNENGVFNCPQNLEDVVKSNGWFGNIPQEVYFIACDSHPLGKIHGGDHYIQWGLTDKNYRLEKSRNGEYPKCPHGKVIASTNPAQGVPIIPKSFLFDFVNTKGTIEYVDLEENDSTGLKVTSAGEVVVSLKNVATYTDWMGAANKLNTIDEKDNCMKIKKLTAKEAINAKFKNTLMTVEGYFKEAKGDYESGSGGYSAKAVYVRMSDIKAALLKDIEDLAESIEV